MAATNDPATACPACPQCAATCGVPLTGDRCWTDADSGDAPDLRCAACGYAWTATPAERALSARAEAAWDARRAGRPHAVVATAETSDPRQLALPTVRP